MCRRCPSSTLWGTQSFCVWVTSLPRDTGGPSPKLGFTRQTAFTLKPTLGNRLRKSQYYFAGLALRRRPNCRGNSENRMTGGPLVWANPRCCLGGRHHFRGLGLTPRTASVSLCHPRSSHLAPASPTEALTLSRQARSLGQLREGEMPAQTGLRYQVSGGTEPLSPLRATEEQRAHGQRVKWWMVKGLSLHMHG